jgi:hypothetical protein
MTLKKIYVASSWRNAYQPLVVEGLREAKHEVYDFRNPGPENTGFGWDQIDSNWKSWTPAQFIEALKHPMAQKGYGNDKRAMDWCDVCVLVLPSGNSSHLEAGWCAGRGKATVVYVPELREPELMYKTFEDVSSAIGNPTIYTDFKDVMEFVNNCVIVL